jgi:hypothetical protein
LHTYKNGVPLTGTLSQSSPFDNDGNLLGVGGLANGTLGVTGLISEILIYDRALTASERAAVELYLNNKWSIY